MTSGIEQRPVAVVAGGSAGVGRAVAEMLAGEGFDVAVLARGEARLAATVRVLVASGARAIAVVADVADPAAVDAAAAEVEQRLGPIALWVNSAMVTAFSRFEDVAPRDFERIVDVTFLGQVNGTRAALARMRLRRRGHVVNVGSGLAYRAVPLQAAYCAAKHAINGFTSAVRSELLHDGVPIALSLVQLPAVNTPQFDGAKNHLKARPQPAPPVFEPEAAAAAVRRVVHTKERELWVGGSVVQLIAGQLVLPGWMDAKLAAAGFDAQHSDQRETGDRPDNLHEPVARDVAARGRFGGQARRHARIVNGDRLRVVALAAALSASVLVGIGVGSII